jgi:Trk K+ transport system NAD-binding subunit
VLEIRRQGRFGEETLLPAGDTVLLSGDLLLLLGPTESIERLGPKVAAP